MRKSSLGRRSSTHIPVRVSNSGSSSAQRTVSGGKQRGSLLKPGFSQVPKQQRALSEDRESYGGRSVSSGMTRSNSMVWNAGSMTPITPHQNMATSNARPSRAQTMSSDSNRRMSSFGGVKNVRKDSRPISEKAFQAAAQQKVQQYFEEYGTQVISPGTSIKPMNTKLFVDMIDHLLKEFDSRIVITKSNYLEELPSLLKGFGYRSKVDRSWLLTVNTPHSWPHVIAVLSWLVESIEAMNCIDPFHTMYQNIVENEESEDDIEITGELIQQLKVMHRISADPTKSDEEKYRIMEEMDSEFITNKIVEQKCTDEDFEQVEREIKLIKEEVEIESSKRDDQLEYVEALSVKCNALLKDCQSTEQFIEQSDQFVQNNGATLDTLVKEIAVKRSVVAKKQEELQKLQEKVNCQKISMEEKEKLNNEKHELHRMIQLYENSIRGYEKTAFTMDLKFASDQRKMDEVLLAYNNIVAEKMVVEPRLKNLEVKLSVMSNSEEIVMETVETNLNNLKQEYREHLQSFESKVEEAEKILWRAKQDKKETEEEIAKETAQLEGLECDLEKQEEMINKETQKLKDKCNHYLKMTKEIMDECSQFDSAKLREKKLELRKLEHDRDLLRNRTETVLNKLKSHIIEEWLKLEAPLTRINQKVQDIVSKHL